MINFECDITIECEKCGAELEATIIVDGYGNRTIRVEQCDTCIDSTHREGYDKGYDKGYGEGYESGVEVK